MSLKPISSFLISLDTAAREACADLGVQFRSVPADGLFHPADLVDDHRGRGDGRIMIFQDRQGGIVWNHKGEHKAFFVDRKGGAPVITEERQRIRDEQERRDRERKARQDKTAKRAASIFKAAELAPLDHSYLLKKCIKAHRARIADWCRTFQDGTGKHQKLTIENTLLIPMYNEHWKLRNLQGIFPQESPELGRGKDFLPGGELSGLFWWIGEKAIPSVLLKASPQRQHYTRKPAIGFILRSRLIIY
ncbi:hypothetical protein [Methylobacter sp. BlB1]|uniref:hypothetical protein n=1 Tax=Methylobacter sp. BlB1 TaxID=2785914 RepID=UPI00351B24C7